MTRTLPIMAWSIVLTLLVSSAVAPAAEPVVMQSAAEKPRAEITKKPRVTISKDHLPHRAARQTGQRRLSRGT